MALLDGFVAQVKCREQCIMDKKRVHAIKFQAIATLNGLIANLYGPIEDRHHDNGILVDSAILRLLQQY